jgi:branched-subunit amino acid aminotransferase/4-amino-4-deoxychorismate lyase
MYSDDKIKEYIKKLIRKNGFNGALKIAVIKNKNLSDLIIMMKNSTYNYKDYQKGFRLTISSVLRNTTAKLVNYKTLNYLENLLEFKSAKAKGYDEVIFFNEKKYLAEGAISNIFLVKDKILYTPKTGSGLLEGIMRNKVIEKSPFTVIEKDLRIEDVDTADEVFITNSLMRVMPVSSIQGTSYHQSNYKIIEYIRKEL